MPVQQYEQFYNCTPAQYITAMATTLPAAGFTVIQAESNFSGLIIQPNFTFTATTNGTTALTAVSSEVGFYIGMPVSGAGIQPGTTITAFGTTVATLSLPATTSVVGDLFTATGVGQVDFQYDGQYFLKFFGANPIPVALQAFPGIPQSQLSPQLIAFLNVTLLALLGVPVIAPNLAIPPNYVP